MLDHLQRAAFLPCARGEGGDAGNPLPATPLFLPSRYRPILVDSRVAFLRIRKCASVSLLEALERRGGARRVDEEELLSVYGLWVAMWRDPYRRAESQYRYPARTGTTMPFSEWLTEICRTRSSDDPHLTLPNGVRDMAREDLHAKPGIALGLSQVPPNLRHQTGRPPQALGAGANRMDTRVRGRVC